MAAKRERRIPEKKIRMRKEFEELLRNNRYLLVVDAYRLKASMANEVRRLQPKLGFRMKGGKMRVLLKAIENVYPEAAKELADKLSGQLLFIFTNENPFRIAYELDKFEVAMEASPGDIAPEDIIIPEGNTGIPPGPVIGVFSALSIPTKIVAGSIYVAKDVLVAKKGDKISPNLANILSKLGIKPIKSKVSIKFAYDFVDNILIPRELLIPDIEAIKSDIEKAALNAFKLAMEIEYITRRTIEPLLLMAMNRARALAVEAEYIDKSTIEYLITMAVARANRLASEAGIGE